MNKNISSEITYGCGNKLKNACVIEAIDNKSMIDALNRAIETYKDWEFQGAENNGKN